MFALEREHLLARIEDVRQGIEPLFKETSGGSLRIPRVLKSSLFDQLRPAKLESQTLEGLSRKGIRNSLSLTAPNMAFEFTSLAKTKTIYNFLSNQISGSVRR